MIYNKTILNNRHGKMSMGFVSLSAFAHGAILLALILVPNLKQLPTGSNVDIDFVGASEGQPEPIGESTPAPDVPQAKVEPTPVTPPAPVITPAPMPKPIKVVKAVATKPAPLAAPKVNKPKVIEIPMDQQEEMPTEVDTSETPQREDLATAAAEAAVDKQVSEEEHQKQTEELPPKITPVQEEPVKIAEPQPERVKETPVEKAPANTNNPTATQDSVGEQTTAKTTLPGETRSYLDLKQSGGNVPPQYPPLARRNGWQGEVMLNYYVTSAGNVQDVNIVESSGFEDLDQAAVKAISKYRYISGQEGWTSHPVIFSLKGGPTSAPSKLRTTSSGAVKNKGG